MMEKTDSPHAAIAVELLRRALTAFSLALLCFTVDPAFAQRIKLNVSYSSINTDQLPAWAAKEAGIFAKNGLDVQLVYVRPTMSALGLITGDTPIAQTAGTSIVSSHVQGSDTVMIAGGFVTLNHWLISRPEIKTPQQLKGGAVAVGAIGSLTDFVARFALQKIGLVPLKDVSMAAIGAPPDRLLAVETGRAQATVLTPPGCYIAQKKGFNVLADVAAYNLPYQVTGVATTRKFIEKSPDIVTRYVKSQIEAVHRLKTDREFTIRVLTKYFPGLNDRDILEKTYELLVKNDKILPPKQYPTIEGLKTILDTLAEREPKAKRIKPEEIVDLRFVKELDESGLVDRLYKN
ncbi:MAG: ABC transporter substrate-binding protein [Deltaproteobacteria bacterium]|jgi:NitT/TauT family transport system substrate-binding protein|nr:ABC transporter substrate-binding protein [Deltaproteobacteria bacterium]